MAVPTVPGDGRMCRERSATVTMTSMKPPVVATMATMIGMATATSGAVGLPTSV